MFNSGHDVESDSIQEANALGAVETFMQPTEFGVLLDCVCLSLGVSVDVTLLAAAK